jgi:hypothetical protein
MKKYPNHAIEPIAVYHAKQRGRYEQAIANWKADRGGFPHLPMYLFYTKGKDGKSRGEVRKTGYVVLAGGSHTWASNRAKAEAMLNAATV